MSRLRDDCFALPPGVDWTPVDEALTRLRDGLSPVTGVETLPLEAASGRVLAEPVVATRANPPAANAAVDGFAFMFADLHGADEATLPLADGRAAAGRAPDALIPGHAMRILTGGLIPEGADSVVLDEDCLRDGDTVRIRAPRKRGANVRAAGEDCAPGQTVLDAGRRLAPQDLARAAAAGAGRLAVRLPLRVGVLSTGDEIVPPGEAARADEIADANRPLLLALAAAWGFAAIDLGIAPDDAGTVRAALDRGAADADAILTSGGASAGDEDHISRLLREEGRIESWRIAVKPGRPLALGMWKGVPVFGLPGNPVAAFTCALVFARPALMTLAGAGWPEPQGFTVPAAFAKAKKAGRREYLRARLDMDGAAEVFRSEGSGLIGGLSWAEGFVELAEPAADIRHGDPVRFMPYASFGLQP